MWDERYRRPGYLFGTEPAVFVTEQAGRLAPGSRVLCVADGEGRNSVWLAGQGHDVVAFEQSTVALEKARALAGDRGVNVDFRQADIFAWDWAEWQFDAVVAVFIQFMGPEGRRAVFAGLKRAVNPGGLILLHGYTPKQLDYGTGGPGRVENLYTEGMLRAAFDPFEILRCAAYDREVDEGKGHSGMSALIDLVARRPAGERPALAPAHSAP